MPVAGTPSRSHHRRVSRQLSAQCVICGGGPAGMMLGYLLARAGVEVVVMEKHADFLRDFRGDTIHPSTLEVMGELGLLEDLLRLPHSKITRLDVVLKGWRFTPVDFGTLRTTCRFLGLMPQWDFLDFLAARARGLPRFRLVMQADVTDVMWRDGRVAGVAATTPDGPLEVRADLTVAADGRASTLRERAGMPVREFGVPIDVLWFRLPKPANPPPVTLAYLDSDVVLTIDRGDYYQSGLLIAKGAFEGLQAAGLEAFHRRIVAAAPVLSDVVSQLSSWDQVKLLTVQVNRLSRWHRPGLLCIGDAAHAMSPAFGVGVNYAIQDAVATANLLAGPLLDGTLSAADLAAVQRRRELPVRLMQPVQLLLHRRIARPGGPAGLGRDVPAWARTAVSAVLPVVRRVSARMIGIGFRPEHVRPGTPA